ncbi:MAG: F0F1 ATP synthase subunit alpha [Lautropia sp.]
MTSDRSFAAGPATTGGTTTSGTTPGGTTPGGAMAGDTLARATRAAFDGLQARATGPLVAEPVGEVMRVGGGIARVRGLAGLRNEEVVRFDHGIEGLAVDLLPDDVGVLLLGTEDILTAGSLARRTGRIADVPVGEGLLGRVLDARGAPLDALGSVQTLERRAVEVDAPAILDRAPVVVPLQTGIRVVDALVPIGRGQRELILGDRQTGKTTLAIDTILNQRGRGVLCVYCAIGQRGSAIARVVDTLRESGALAYTVVMVASDQDPPGLKYLTPFAATSVAEHFMRRGRDVLVVYDDLTRHARAYRELSLLLRRPPGREAYPGDVFYLHARLLERATRLAAQAGGGSLTALPIAETQAQDVSAYIPTNLISITDGQLFLSPDLMNRGVLPPVDVGRSVSRTGGKTQIPALRAVAGPLRLAYAQFEEVESFARFASRLDDATKRTIERGRRVREVLKQAEHDPMPQSAQVAVLHALSCGRLDAFAPERIASVVEAIGHALCADEAREAVGDVAAAIEAGERLDEAQWDRLAAWVAGVCRAAMPPTADGRATAPAPTPGTAEPR